MGSGASIRWERGVGTDPPKKQVADRDRRYHAAQVGQQATGDGMAGAADADGAEVGGERVEGGPSRALDHARQAAGSEAWKCLIRASELTLAALGLGMAESARTEQATGDR